MLVESGEDCLQVGVVEVTSNNKSSLRVFGLMFANGCIKFFHSQLSISIRGGIHCSEYDGGELSREVTGQTKSGSQAHHEQKNIKDRYVARIGVTGAPTLEPGLGLGLAGPSAWWPGLCPRDPARAQPEMADVGPPSSRLTTRRKVHEGPVQCGLGSSRGMGGLDDPIPGPKLWQ
ncbi:hypothetical protein L3Q82_001853 [Scortum barcoo]|uniref:Uncharacterized protein n=1 Tax=Scortum barcoo TaxID=214431 RepID=A0ACB8W4Y9_9TELE|nr:hypothetical protein L3Q82_001853 [Scortum barcoo]